MVITDRRWRIGDLWLLGDDFRSYLDGLETPARITFENRTAFLARRRLKGRSRPTRRRTPAAIARELQKNTVSRRSPASVIPGRPQAVKCRRTRLTSAVASGRHWVGETIAATSARLSPIDSRIDASADR